MADFSQVDQGVLGMVDQDRESFTSPGNATPARGLKDPLQRPAKRVQKAPRINIDAPPKDFKQEHLVRQHKPVPRHGWRRTVYSMTFGFVNLGPSEAEISEKEIAKRVRTPLKGTRRIAVISRKGGVGKTTTTIMLGHVFAAWRGDRVVALDGNPDAGSLAYRVRKETQKTLSDLLENTEPIERYADMRAYTSQAPTRLEVLASDDDPRIATAQGESEYHRVIDMLERHYNILLMDTGTGILDSATRGILDMADQLVVVMAPSVDSARALSLTLDWLDQHGYESLVKSSVAVVNGVRNDSPVELKRMESHFENRVAEIVRIPWDPHLDAGAETAIDELRASTRAAYLKLAAAEAAKFAQEPQARDRVAKKADEEKATGEPIESKEEFDTSGNTVIDLTDHTAKIDAAPATEEAEKTKDNEGEDEVCTIIGVTYRQLDYWDRTDLVHPSLSEAQGSGTQRLYSYRDLLELKVIKRMLDANLDLPGIRRAVGYLRSEFGQRKDQQEDIANANLVIDGKRVLLARSNEELIDIFQGGQGVLSGVYSILAIPLMRQEIDAALETIVPDTQKASKDNIVIDLRDKPKAPVATASQTS